MIPRSTVEGGGATRGMCIYFMAPQTIILSMYAALVTNFVRISNIADRN